MAAAGNSRDPSPPWDDPDFVDRVFDYLLAEFPHLAGPQFDRARQAVRHEHCGSTVYIRKSDRGGLDAQSQRNQQILALFNGRNAREVARTLKIGRATVYRVLKQAGKVPDPHEPQHPRRPPTH